MLVMVAFGLLVRAPGLVWALGEDAAGCWISNANPLADQAIAKSEEQFATAGIGLMTAPCQFAPTFGSDGMDSQAFSAALTSSTNDPDPDPAAVEKERLKINPVTGLPAASESNYSPLIGSERWKLYFKMNYWSVGAYFGPVFSALVLDQSTGSPREWGRRVPWLWAQIGLARGQCRSSGHFSSPSGRRPP
jgi:hypothetical protein